MFIIGSSKVTHLNGRYIYYTLVSILANWVKIKNKLHKVRSTSKFIRTRSSICTPKQKCTTQI